MNEAQHVKIAFKLDQGEDGYPPVQWEDLWAIPLGEDKFKVDNVPFYAKLISSCDIVVASMEAGRWVFQRLVAMGGHSTLRVIVNRPEVVSMVREELANCGCSTELSHIPSFFSVDVPPEIGYGKVVAVLARHAELGVLDYEEASIQHEE